MNSRESEEHLAPTLYYDRYLELDAAKIMPGEYFVTQRDMVIVTVLGSCVSACVCDRRAGVGGMNHFMLPGSEGHDSLSSSARYGVYAMEVLINQLLKLGARRNQLEAKLFGGGRVLRGFTVGNVGERNAEFALNYLATEKISVVARDLEDIYPRKVYYFPRTGRALVKKLKTVHNDTVVAREREYEARLRQSKVEGEVELF